MPEGWRVSLLCSPTHAMEFDDVCFVMDGTVPRLTGEVSRLTTYAGCSGAVIYFPTIDRHGFPIMFRTHSAHFRFWWLMQDMLKSPDRGVTRPLSWGQWQTTFTRLTMAEFSTFMLEEELVRRIKAEPDFEDVDLEMWISELMVMLAEMVLISDNIASYVPTYSKDVLPGGKLGSACIESQMIHFLDGSRMLVDTQGFSVVQDNVCRIIVCDTSTGGRPALREVVIPQGIGFSPRVQ